MYISIIGIYIIPNCFLNWEDEIYVQNENIPQDPRSVIFTINYYEN